jgi:hypothetical protein
MAAWKGVEGILALFTVAHASPALYVVQCCIAPPPRSARGRGAQETEVALKVISEAKGATLGETTFNYSALPFWR